MIYKTLKQLFLIILALASLNASAENIINQDFLNQFQGIAIKRVSLSDSARNNSHMYELHGTVHFRKLLGEPDKEHFNTEFVYFSDEQEQTFTRKITWYLANKNKSYASHRFYYGSSNPIMKLSNEGDLLILGKVDEDNLKVLVFKKDSEKEKLVLDLLNIETEKDSIQEDDFEETDLKVMQDKDSKYRVIIGKVSKVYDGDTFTLDGLFKVRMLGIDTPEKRQLCKNKKGKEYKCGEKAKKHLMKLLGKRRIACEMHGWGAYNRHLFICKNSKGVDINRQMVRDGYAVMSTYKPFRYKEDEQYAKDHQLGLWSGEFMHPREFRKNKKQKKM